MQISISLCLAWRHTSGCRHHGVKDLQENLQERWCQHCSTSTGSSSVPIFSLAHKKNWRGLSVQLVTRLLDKWKDSVNGVIQGEPKLECTVLGIDLLLNLRARGGWNQLDCSYCLETQQISIPGTRASITSFRSFRGSYNFPPPFGKNGKNHFPLSHFPTLSLSHFRSCHYKEYYISSTCFFYGNVSLQGTFAAMVSALGRTRPATQKSKSFSHFPNEFPLSHWISHFPTEFLTDLNAKYSSLGHTSCGRHMPMSSPQCWVTASCAGSDSYGSMPCHQLPLPSWRHTAARRVSPWHTLIK
jgi:hypothetical protein